MVREAQSVVEGPIGGEESPISGEESPISGEGGPIGDDINRGVGSSIRLTESTGNCRHYN